MRASDLKKLCETDKLFVGHDYETAFLIEKLTGQSTELGWFYGDPSCGLIDKNDEWCMVGGNSGLSIWLESKVIEINDTEFHWTHDLRQTDSQKVQILTDPWAESSAIWELNIQTLERHKIRDFDDYKDELYTENVIW